jgi:hypothetical protein
VSKVTGLKELIDQRIAALRPKLLDLTKRNPLLSTRFSDRSNTIVRIVDEVPSFLFNKMCTGEKMKIVPLPDLELEPKDESTREFQSALSDARLHDPLYLAQLDEIDQQSAEAPNLLAKTDRDLKDRLRKTLGLPLRQTKTNPRIDQHALNHGIDPNYELPTQNDAHQDGRHGDNKIQTLLLPDALERRLNALISKDSTWKQEAGINVLHATFGFLEWTDGAGKSVSYSPLILIPIEIEKKRTNNGIKFEVFSGHENGEGNTILAEKLRLEFGIEFPLYKPEVEMETYFAEVSNLKPQAIGTWKVHRWVNLGVFPSTRLAMYHDLQSENWNFSEHPILAALFGGSDVGVSEIPFGDEHDIDDPSIEAKMPLLIADADSSQASVVVDVANGKNISVEGPPGTGKSQTIVNTIATSLAAGKKVLFVAEKSAALEVVHNRLKEFGLEDFILSLQATRSSKEQIIESIRNRLTMSPAGDPLELDQVIRQFKQVREDLGLYIQTMASRFENTGQTVHRIIGRSISHRSEIEWMPEIIRNFRISNTQMLTISDLLEIKEICERLETIWIESNNYETHWKGLQTPNLDPFQIPEILDIATKAAAAYKDCFQKVSELSRFDIDPNTQIDHLFKLSKGIGDLPHNISYSDIKISEKIVLSASEQKIETFLKDVENSELELSRLQAIVKNPFLDGVSDKLSGILDELSAFGSLDFSLTAITAEIESRSKDVSDLTETMALLRDYTRILPNFSDLPLKYLIEIADLIKEASRQSLKLRINTLHDPQVRNIIEKAKRVADVLALKKVDLDQKFILSLASDRQEVFKHTSILLNASIFSFLSPPFRQARQFYRSLSKGGPSNRRLAAQELQTLGVWLSDLEAHNSNPELAALFGNQFQGLDTPLDGYLEVLDYYERVDSRLAGSDTVELRAFLRSCDYETLISLPQVAITHPARAFLELKVASCEKLLKNKEIELQKVQSIAQKIGVIRSDLHRHIWSAEELARFIVRLKSFLENWKTLESSEAKDVLGPYFKGAKTQKSDLKPIMTAASVLEKLPVNLRSALISSLKDDATHELHKLLFFINEATTQSDILLKGLSGKTGVRYTHPSKAEHFEKISNYLFEAAQEKHALLIHSKLYGIKQELSAKGLGPLIQSIFDVYSEPNCLAKTVQSVISISMAQEVYLQYSAILTKFNGEKLSSLRKQLAKCDAKIIELSRARLEFKLFGSSHPPRGVGTGLKSTWSELALLRHQVTLQKRYAPMRALTSRAGKALIEIKPCWMMSPLSVAQYIPKGTITFDLVIIDEASQMTPEDSIGALVRAKQVMVVGDTNQLPPSDFFKKVFEDEDLDEDLLTTEESILEMARAAFKPSRRLRWHYRSRHSGLIAFSNRHIYKNNLVVFPSPHEKSLDKGVFHVKVEGLYNSGTNPIEAKAMVDEAINFMRVQVELIGTDKVQSLGLITLNQQQKALIEEELNFAYEEYSWVAKYKEYWEEKRNGIERFFIKNLENVQGDERDVIFIGTVYGPEKLGTRVKQRFGPINGVAGRRRLNVLFSRAKNRIVTFSSMLPGDIQADENTNPGTYMLKQWLEYSADGKIDSGTVTNEEPDSEFEQYVIDQVRSIGCEAIPQVGVSGYFIDIGVRHPDWPYGFIMGVECDGAAYHSSKSARDRDRLRQSVLEGLGWTLYRIWSTDWFEDPVRETRKLRDAIQNRMNVILRESQQLDHGQEKHLSNHIR